MKKIYIFLMLSLGLYHADMQAVMDIQVYKKPHTLFDIMQYYRSHVQSYELSELNFFIELAESLAVDQDSLTKITVDEHNSIQELRDFYMTFALADNCEKENLIRNFAPQYQQIYSVLNNVVQRFVAHQ